MFLYTKKQLNIYLQLNLDYSYKINFKELKQILSK